MERKGPKAPFTLLTLILLFGKKKQSEEPTPQPTTPEPFQTPDILKKTVTTNDISKARDRLRIANLERDIIGDALTKIYEAETKGQINESEKPQLLQRYKTDLKRVDGEIDAHKKTVDLYDLESAKEELLKSFHEKMLEIDLKINQIRPTLTLSPFEKTVETTSALQKPEIAETPPTTTSPKERAAREKPKNKAEEKLESIREEVLKAMERLEQIETEG